MRRRIRSAVLAATMTVTAYAAVPAYAAPFEYIRIGDLDGFGYTPTAGLKAANGANADTNGNNLLQQTEFLPDRNQNGITATGQGDDFNNRTAAEVGNTFLQIIGATNIASTGSKWTDLSLSTSYDVTFPNNLTNSDPLDDFPDPAGDNLPNEPRFYYEFFVATGDIDPSSPLYFNLIFGDYDVSPANVKITRTNGTQFTVPLTLQPGTQDGLIQAAYTTLGFSDVFTATTGGWNGKLTVDFVAPNEPYTAFDFAELGTTQISFTPVPAGPSVALLLAALGLGAALGRRARR
jgi:hypothetical protein